MIHEKTRLYLLCFAAMVGLVVVSGCHDGLQAERSSHLIFDPIKDEFAYVRVYQHIYAKRLTAIGDEKVDPKKVQRDREESLDYLKSLWENRSDLIMYPNPPDLISGSKGDNDQLLVVNPHEYRSINLQKRGKALELERSPIDLSQIVIRPSEMFLSPKGTLCYCHGCYFPGTFVDKVLGVLATQFNSSVLDEMVAERMRRKEANEARQSWADLRRDIRSDSKVDRASKMGGPFGVLSDDSIRLLIHQASGTHLSLSREREHVVVRFKLAPSDASELASTKLLLDEVISMRLAKAKASPSKDEGEVTRLEVETRMLRGVKLKTDTDGTVTVRVDLLILSVPEKDEADVGIVLPEAREDVAAIESRGVPINRSLTLQKVLEEFGMSRSGSKFLSPQ